MLEVFQKLLRHGAGGQETILLVEDQEPVRMLTARLLHDLGYRVLTATDGRDALRRFQLYSGRIDLLFSDMVMPGMGGIELAEIMQKTRTNLHVLFMTGHSERAAAADIWDQASGELLHKPFTAVALADAVRRALDARD